MIDFALKDIEKYFGANHVLKGVTFEVKQGERIGLLGKNGSGKTTLFNIISGKEKCDGGNLMLRKNAAVGVLEQLPRYPENYTAYDVLYSAFESLHEIYLMMTQMESIMSGGTTDEYTVNKYGKMQQEFEVMGGYSIEEYIGRVCSGLKIDEEMKEKLFINLSGGEKTRVVLGRLLLCKPEIMLLDEPTNHLDTASIEWLEEFMSHYEGTAVIISHDRYFLDRVVNGIVELVNGKAEIYPGNYSDYAREKEARYLNQLEKYEQEQKKIKQLENAAKRMHEWAKMADNPAMHKRAFNIEKRIERMDKTEKPVKEKEMNASFSELNFSGKEIVAAINIIKAYEGRTILNKLYFAVQKSERVAVIGNNGSGKTTLFRLITGELEPDVGTVKVGDSIRWAYLPQNVSFENPELTILEFLRNTLEISEGEARNILAKYRFAKDDVHKKVKALSGGEKSRLVLCTLMHNNVNLLLLDEPTNHLDIQSREWLEKALAEYNGTIIFISHDRYFINKFATRISELSEGNIQDYYGNYEFYKAKKHEEESASCSQDMNGYKSSKSIKTISQNQAEKTGKLNAKTECDKLETGIQGLELKLKEIELQIHCNASDYEELNRILIQKNEIEADMEKLYMQWLLLQE